MTGEHTAVFLCNDAKKPSRKGRYRDAASLEYRPSEANPRNVEVSLPSFVNNLWHVPSRLLDLLEIACYVFAGDRLTKRGRIDSLEYHSWARRFEYVIRVREPEFWNRRDVTDAMTAALQFMTGDRQYAFLFQGGHTTPPTQLFDAAGATVAPPQSPQVLLFSGGLDSLAGVLEVLGDSETTVCTVSHESQHGTIKTQRGLISGLQERFPQRIHPFPFRCRLADTRAAEETQRTRSFLYFSVAFVVARCLGMTHFSVYENGYTAFAFPERQDLMNARASRTTHPKTVAFMARFLGLVAECPFAIQAPFRWKTKADVLRMIHCQNAADLLTSSVSCSASFQPSELGRQCGKCSQCIERRLAAYAAGLGDIDSSGTYNFDFVRSPVEDGETRTLLIDYLRLALHFATRTETWFAQEKINELTDLVEYIEGADEVERIGRVWTLCNRHGNEVFAAVRRIRDECNDLTMIRQANSLLDIVASQEYLKEPVERLVNRITSRLSSAIPLAFKSRQPGHENEVNDQIEAILASDAIEFEREFPVIRYGTAKTVPDHATKTLDLFVEAKLLRESATSSKITDELAADTVKYGKHTHILFVLYDPFRAIKDDCRFAEPFEKERRCTVCFIR